MRVQMKRRYRDGIALTAPEFSEQDWTIGNLVMDAVEGRNRLAIHAANPDAVNPPKAVLWRPELAACALGSISFAGTEQIGKRWCYQVWFCEVRG